MQDFSGPATFIFYSNPCFEIHLFLKSLVLVIAPVAFFAAAITICPSYILCIIKLPEGTAAPGTEL